MKAQEVIDSAALVNTVSYDFVADTLDAINRLQRMVRELQDELEAKDRELELALAEIERQKGYQLGRKVLGLD